MATSASPRAARPTNPRASSPRSSASASGTRPPTDPNRAPRAAFSRTLIAANVRGFCSTIEIPVRRVRWGGSLVTSTPMNVIVPTLGVSSPITVRNSVVLPAPLGPTRAMISPSSTCNDTSLTAGSPPKRFSTPSSSRIGTVMSGARYSGS